MLQQRYFFLEASNFNMYNLKERHFFIEKKSMFNVFRQVQAWHDSKRVKCYVCMGQNVLKGRCGNEVEK